MATERVLFDMLKILSSEELHHFSLHVELETGVPLMKKVLPKEINTEVIVELMVKTYGTECVELTRKILKKRQRLSDLSLWPREKHPAFKHWPSFSQRVKMMMFDIQLLLRTLPDLKKEELFDFKWTLLRMAFPVYSPEQYRRLLRWTDYQETVFLIVLFCGDDSVGLTKDALTKIGRTDLEKRMTDSSQQLRKQHSSEQQLRLIWKVATMAAIRHLLLEILRCLSEEEFMTFQRLLQMKESATYSRFMRRFNEEVTVDWMMHTYGRRCVELTREALMKMNRTDLMEILTETSSASTEKPPVDEPKPTVTDETVKSDVNLLKMLSSLEDKELTRFKFLVQFEYFLRSIQQIDWDMLLRNRDVHGLVDLMMMKEQAVEVAMEVLKDMKVKGLPEREDYVFELSKTLLQLTHEEHELFQKLLLRKHNQIVPEHRVQAAGIFGMAELMVEIFGPLSVEVTEDILKKMGKTDLVERLLRTKTQIPSGAQFPLVEELHSVDMQKELNMTPLHDKLLGILEELSSGELEQFKHVLQYTKMREGLPKMPRDQVETADKRQTVKLMVEIYGQQCVEVTKDTLEMINRSDLVEKLSESTSGSEGLSRRLGPEDCECKVQDSSDWTILEPGVKSTDGDEFPTYSLQSEAGSHFECRVSGMRWTCKEEVSFQYQLCSWGEHVERIEGLRYLPAGPLMNIKITAGKFDEVYLPHWICFEDDPQILDKFAVLHIDDCGDVVEKVSEVTPTHVKLCDPVFSPKGVLIRAGAPVKTHCNVLIYKTNTAFLTLHVYLIPHDPGLKQEMDRRESSYGYKIIRKPPPEKSLRMGDHFILTADVKAAKINPEERKLRYEWKPSKFFEVFIDNPKGEVTLKLAQKKESTSVWICPIQQAEYQSPGNTKDKQPVAQDLSAYFKEAATIRTDEERLLETLEELKPHEFDKFKWLLRIKSGTAGLPPIKACELENKSMSEVVDLMFGRYGRQCLELTKIVLTRMQCNNLAQML